MIENYIELHARYVFWVKRLVKLPEVAVRHVINEGRVVVYVNLISDLRRITRIRQRQLLHQSVFDKIQLQILAWFKIDVYAHQGRNREEIFLDVGRQVVLLNYQFIKRLQGGVQNAIGNEDAGLDAVLIERGERDLCVVDRRQIKCPPTILRV